MTPTPEDVVDTQFKAYNANDAEALAATFAEDAHLFQHPSTLMMSGRAQIAARYQALFEMARPQAKLVNRIAMGDLVIDHETVTTFGEPGPAKAEAVAIYQVRNGLVANAWFSMANMAQLRAAQAADIPAMETLIARSGIELSKGFYTDEQALAVTTHVFGVDTQLVTDQTYFVIEQNGQMVACGGWSKRATLFGADRTKGVADPLLDPATQPARIRAFFVSPDAPRQGLGRMLLNHCAAKAAEAGFTALELAGTMPGVPLYLACGFHVVEDFEITLPGNVKVPLSRMRKEI
jgi:uncharacterized protein (TIGR02246 family)